jgi:hypothetical protein
MALEGPPVPPTPRQEPRRSFDAWADGVVDKAFDFFTGKLKDKLSEKLLEAYKMGRKFERNRGEHEFGALRDLADAACAMFDVCPADDDLTVEYMHAVARFREARTALSSVQDRPTQATAKGEK